MVISTKVWQSDSGPAGHSWRHFYAVTLLKYLEKANELLKMNLNLVLKSPLNRAQSLESILDDAASLMLFIHDALQTLSLRLSLYF